jgi:HEAT repeat protein
VVTARLAQCPAASLQRAEPPEDVDERVDGLLATLTSAQARMREIALEELGGLGDGVVETLELRLGDRSRDAPTRSAAAEALGVLGAGGSRAAAEALLARLESSRGAVEPEPWIYAQCAWRLGRVEQPWVVPRLLLCLKYETDHETVVWIADSLARYGLLSGLDALFVVAQEGSADVRGHAQGVLLRLQGELGASDWNDLARRWRAGEEPPSERLADERYACEAWRTIAALAEWQLRGVDDGRYVLSRLGSGEARWLGEALADEDVYVRLHSAQCLERMGPRGAPAGPDLVARLDDPQVGPQAAAALGAVGHAPAAGPLQERAAAGRPLELRVAAVRALGQLAPPGLEALARPLLEPDEPVDLRCAAAAALLAAAPADAPAAALAQPVRLLIGWMTSGEVDPRVPEDALGTWLGLRAEVGDDAARALLDAWLEVPLEPDLGRIEQRAALLTARASELGL